MHSTRNHPAFIENYTAAHTEILKTMPNGTYAIHTYTPFEPTLFEATVVFNGVVRSYSYIEEITNYINKQRYSLKFLDYGVMKDYHFFDNSIFELAGNGKDIHKCPVDFDSVQLTGTLRQKFIKHSPYMLYLYKDAQEKLAQPYQLNNNSVLNIKMNIIDAINRDIHSGRFKFTRGYMTNAVEKLQHDCDIETILQLLHLLIKRVVVLEEQEEGLRFFKNRNEGILSTLPPNIMPNLQEYLKSKGLFEDVLNRFMQPHDKQQPTLSNHVNQRLNK